MDLRQIEERLARILIKADGWLPSAQLQDMASLANAGEPGVASENFWTQLEEYEVAVPSDMAQELKQLAECMDMNVPSWAERRPTAPADSSR